MHVNKQVKYAVKCRIATFLGYLRDAKAVRLELVDRRNNELVGWVDIALLVYLPAQLDGSNRLIDFVETFTVVKHPTKGKLGELEVSVVSDFEDDLYGQLQATQEVGFEQQTSLNSKREQEELHRIGTFAPI